MITKLCRKIADFFIRENIIPEEQREVYEYGFELSVSSVIGIIIVLGIGLISGKFWESVVFYIVFCFTRIFSGGFHAPNYLLCKLTLAGVLLAVLGIEWLLRDIVEYYWFVLYLYGLIVVCSLSPVENENKELTERVRVRCKVTASVVSVVWLAVMFLFIALDSDLYHIVALTLFFVANLMLLGKLYERRKRK